MSMTVAALTVPQRPQRSKAAGEDPTTDGHQPQRPEVPIGAMLVRVLRPCPECSEPLDLIEGYEMGGAPGRYRCRWCLLTFERDASGLMVEVD